MVRVQMAMVLQLAISPDCQKRGVAMSLVKLAMEDTANVQEWTVSYRSFNSLAERFYRSLGFVDSEHCHDSLDPAKYRGMVLVLSSSI